MLLRMIFEEVGDIVVYLKDDEEFSKKLVSSLPLTSKVMVWKEEVYFETPIEARIKRKTLKVKKGDVAYWPPGKAMCIFYGISQPYGLVEVVGEVIGPVYYLRDVKPDSEVKLELIDEETRDPLVNALTCMGLRSTKRKEEGSVVTNIYVGNERLGLELYPEDYGIIIETDGLLMYDLTASTQILARKFKELIEGFIEGVRIDVNEDNYLCLSSYAEGLEELPHRIRELARAYDILTKYM